MLPNTMITIDPKKGTHQIEVMEKSDQCHKLSDLAKTAGKVLSDDDKDHAPVYQAVQQKN